MGELINGRTPEEIKQGIRCDVPCGDCAYTKCAVEDDNGCIPYVERDALALIERLESERDAALAKRPKWISVKERLPRCGERVLVCNGGSVWEAYLSISHKWIRQEFVWAIDVTHWMHLPQPPEEE